MFLTGGALILVALMHFIMAGALTQVICDKVNNADNQTEMALNLPKLRIESKYDYQLPPYYQIIKYVTISSFGSF